MACFAYNLILEMKGLSQLSYIPPAVVLLLAAVQYSLSSSVVAQVLVCQHDSTFSEGHNMRVAGRMSSHGKICQ